MGFLNSLQNAGTKTKLNGEILLLDRELVARKKLFGIELFDLIDDLDAKSKDSLLKTPALFKGIEKQIQEPLDKCRADVHVSAGEKAEKESKLATVEVRKERDTKGGIGAWVSDSGTQGQLNVQITMLDRTMKQRKEQFGIEIWDIIAQPSGLTDNVNSEMKKKKGGLGAVTGVIGGLGKGVKSTVENGLGKLSSDERAVQQCIEKAKEDIGFIERSKERKQSIIDGLGKSS